jgi:hypothetical protein
MMTASKLVARYVVCLMPDHPPHPFGLSNAGGAVDQQLERPGVGAPPDPARPAEVGFESMMMMMTMMMMLLTMMMMMMMMLTMMILIGL